MLLLNRNVAVGNSIRFTTICSDPATWFSNDSRVWLAATTVKDGVSATKVIQLPVSFLTATLVRRNMDDNVVFGQNVKDAREMEA